ncbi:MAG: polyphosphate kinase 1 [Actinomycetota bacterium]
MSDSGGRGYAPTESAHRYINRELSWLDFNTRVLSLAKETDRPLLERVRFLSIFVANLDEFFQVRVSGLLEQREAGIHQATPDGMTPAEQLIGIRERVTTLMTDVHDLYTDVIAPELEKAGIRLIGWADLDDEQHAWLSDVFTERIFPVLTPLSVDPAHPFPYISSLSLNLALLVHDPVTGGRRFARLKVPPLLPRLFALPDGERFIAIEHVIAAHLDRLFPGMRVGAHYVFRVTRDADLDVEEDEADDLLEEIQTVLLRRRRGASCVRLEVESGTPADVLELLSRELDLEEDQIYESPIPLDISGLDILDALERPELKRDPWVPVTAPALAQHGEAAPDLFQVLRQADVLVHHPYESFVTSVEEFVETAADDPNVLAIKQTVYRTSVGSPTVEALGRAAEMGKQVVALVELKARFDEEANIKWARTLERAGAHVVYGVVGLKTHAKVCLVVRREGHAIRRYAHIGTGNYNSKTASLYEDVGLLTSDQALCTDVADLFNLLTGYSRQPTYGKLLIAPLTLRAALLEMIRSEEAAGPDGEIVLKMNSLGDPELIDALYAASQAGACIDLAVRGVCCLLPGVPGLSESIHVRSIVGRFLEHSRIFRFGSRARGRRYFIGSADIMPRNLDHRVEAVVPVERLDLQLRLDEILEAAFLDDTLASELGPDGIWRRVPTIRGFDAQAELIRLATERARGER